MAFQSVSKENFSQMTLKICEAPYVDGCNEKHILWMSMERSTKALITFTFFYIFGFLDRSSWQ